VTSTTPRNPAPIQAALPIPAAHRPPTQWRESAACRQADPELFFPIGTTGKAAVEIRYAKAVCASCPVQQPCLAYALTTRQEFGIWGGYDENERRPLHRRWRQSLVAQRGDDPA
jgi:WhiB family redox-sensing transcriptional regulator